MHSIKSFILISILFTLSSQAIALEEGEALFKSKCFSCHRKTLPIDMRKVVAPSVMGVMHHIKMNYKSKNEALSFMTDYVMNPSKKKALYRSEQIKRFGLMPSQKENVTEEELSTINLWLFDNFPLKAFRKKEEGTLERCNSNEKIQRSQLKTNPFLIASLPHLSKIIKIHWESRELNLSDLQKEKLLKICHETMKSVEMLKEKIRKIEIEIETLVGKDEKIVKIMPLVKKLALLKVSATEIQLHCLQNSKKILSKNQLIFLLN